MGIRWAHIRTGIVAFPLAAVSEQADELLNCGLEKNVMMTPRCVFKEGVGKICMGGSAHLLARLGQHVPISLEEYGGEVVGPCFLFFPREALRCLPASKADVKQGSKVETSHSCSHLNSGSNAKA